MTIHDIVLCLKGYSYLTKGNYYVIVSLCEGNDDLVYVRANDGQHRVYSKDDFKLANNKEKENGDGQVQE